MGGQGHERPHRNRHLSGWAGTCGVRVGIAPLIKPPRGGGVDVRAEPFVWVTLKKNRCAS